MAEHEMCKDLEKDLCDQTRRPRLMIPFPNGTPAGGIIWQACSSIGGDEAPEGEKASKGEGMKVLADPLRWVLECAPMRGAGVKANER